MRGASAPPTPGAPRESSWLPTAQHPQGVPAFTNIYDSRDWLASTLIRFQQPTLYTNDEAGRLFSVTDPILRTMSFGYDVDGRPRTQRMPRWRSRGRRGARAGTDETDDPATIFASSVYDGTGNQIMLTNRNGKKWEFQLDAANRPTNTITALNRQTWLTYDARGCCLPCGSLRRR